MSGIAGIVRFDGGPVDPADLHAMTDRMRHRGPDGVDHWVDGSVGLGQCMLATTPEALDERQPLTHEDGSLVLVMDGRIDNHEDLRRTLSENGARLRTKTDPELVLRAYEQWGEACVARLEGDFAFVIWNRRLRQAFCARDPAGAKPFVYHRDGDRLVFASEIRPVLERLDPHPAMNGGFVAEALAFFYMSTVDTFWEDVFRLPPAHFMVADEAGCRVERYWRPEDIALISYRKEEEYLEHYLDTFTETVRKLSRATGPLGCEVSGGLDSSSIFVVADRLDREGRLGAGELRGYTLEFEKGSRAYELDYVDAVSRHTGRRIEIIPPVVEPLDWFTRRSAELRTMAVWPHGHDNIGEVRHHARAGGRVLLDGTGGDQFLSSVDNDLAETIQLGNWSELRAMLARDVDVFGRRRLAWRILRHGLLPLLPDRVRFRIRKAIGKENSAIDNSFWLSPRLRTLLRRRRAESAEARRHRMSGVRIGLARRISSLENAYTTLAVEMTDTEYNAAGIEGRSPFYNKGYLEFVLALPLSRLRSGSVNRYLHRQAMTGLLPAEVSNRRGKAVFGEMMQPLVAELAKLQPQTLVLNAEWVRPASIQDVQRRVHRLNHADDSLSFLTLLALAMLHAISEGDERNSRWGF